MKKFHLFLLPLFALALLVGCSADVAEEEQGNENETNEPVGFSGELLEDEHRVVLHTSKGDIGLTLDADSAPRTVTNFILLAQSGFYDGLTFHRVIPDFMIQGGDPNGDGTGCESVFGGPFEDEINAESYGLHKKKIRELAGDEQLPPELEDTTVKEYLELTGYAFDDDLDSLPMKRGAVAMANRGPNTNGSQFFIIQRTDGTNWLEGKHTVFGTVTDGLDVIDEIVAVERDATEKPLEPVTFTVEVVN